MDWIDKLTNWFQKKPLIVARFGPGFEQDLIESSGSLNRFTWAVSRNLADELAVPTLCLVELDEERSSFYIGVILAKSAVTTFDSRLTLISLRRLELTSLENVPERLSATQRSLFWRRFHGSKNPVSLTPALSIAIIRTLAEDSDNKKSIENAARNIPGLQRREDRDWEQLDAVRTAMAAFGITKTEQPAYVAVTSNSDSVMNRMPAKEARVLEDNVIATDASILPGLLLVEKDVTGHAVFMKGTERLDVYTANRGTLEKMLGVDLIYVNSGLGSIVMVQYKMLETANACANEHH